VALLPSANSALTIKSVSNHAGALDFMALSAELSAQTEQVVSGDLSRAEAMLVAQAHTLDAIFNRLARGALNASSLDHQDCLLRLALKAQSQCRASLESLAAIKNPPAVAFVRQANIAHGLQQVNNGVQPAESPRARELKTEQNELLEAKDGERLDTRAQGATGGADPALETVGTVNRTTDV
jgi:hypothetical protein